MRNSSMVQGGPAATGRSYKTAGHAAGNGVGERSRVHALARVVTVATACRRRGRR
ncbi:hypothetical protein [Xanthomonas cannabis]|uniref:hypothetical protein n=1 Tax=Xanthomonas cannabis TaxID=1885674 RepID=UPI00194E470B|nr:hypothetical protein [Xanthomonas cannabis]